MVREVRYYLATLAYRHDNYLQTVSGGKSVKKAVTKVAQGTLKTEGKVSIPNCQIKVNKHNMNVT